MLDGVGAHVAYWDREVGLVVDPAEPNAHGGTLPVTRRLHAFHVVAGRPGRTFVEARRRRAHAMPYTDMFPLVVVEPTTKLTWRPKWRVTLSDRFRVNPWSVRPFGPDPVPGMLLKSAWVEFEGGVDPDESIAPADFELGLLQTVMASRIVATYVGADNRPTWTYTLAQKSVPVRDAADPKGGREPPWYATYARVSLEAARTVKSSDAPQVPVPWRTRNGKGRLVSREGADAFFTWAGGPAQGRREGRAARLGGLAGQLGLPVDPERETYTLNGADTAITGRGDDGAGPVEPNLGELAAIDDISATWTGPPGG